MAAEIKREVTTPLGKGRVVYELPDGTLVVEFPWGGGQIFLAEDLLTCLKRRAAHGGQQSQHNTIRFPDVP